MSRNTRPLKIPTAVFVKVVEAKGSYAAGWTGSGGLIQAESGRRRILGGVELLKRSGLAALAMVRVAARSVALAAARP